MKTDLVLCPDTIMATPSGIPAWAIFLTAVRLKSWKCLMPIFAGLQAFFQALSKRFRLQVRQGRAAAHVRNDAGRVGVLGDGAQINYSNAFQFNSYRFLIKSRSNEVASLGRTGRSLIVS